MAGPSLTGPRIRSRLGSRRTSTPTSLSGTLVVRSTAFAQTSKPGDGATPSVLVADRRRIAAGWSTWYRAGGIVFNGPTFGYYDELFFSGRAQRFLRLR